MEANKRLMEATRKLNDFQKKLLSPPREQSVCSEDMESAKQSSTNPQSNQFNKAATQQLKSIETAPMQTSIAGSLEQPQENDEEDEYYDEEYDPEVEEINDKLTASAQRNSPKKGSMKQSPNKN